MRMPDQLDLKIIDALKEDPQATNKAIAIRLDVSEPSIAQRIRSMSKDNIMRVVAQRDIYAGPYTMTAISTLEVEDSRFKEVGEAVAEFEEVISVATGMRAPRLFVSIRATGRQHLDDFLREQIAQIPGVHTIGTQIMLRIFKYQTGYGLLSTKMPTHRGDNGGDEKDESIIAALLEDGRMSNREIARRLDISESNVRQRLKKMSDEKRMRLGVICDTHAVGKPLLAAGCIKTKAPETDKVITEMVGLEDVGYVGTTSGEFNLFTIAQGTTLESFQKLYFQRVASLSGVLDVQLELYAGGMKQRYDLIRIRD